MINPEQVIVALDSQNEAQVKNLILLLKGTKVWAKVGMELYYALGPKVIEEIKKNELKVFLDLKLHDIPNTVEKSLQALCKHPIDMINVHAAGGGEMLKRAAETVKSSSSSPLLIAVTQLTSTSETQMHEEQNIQGSLTQSVLRYAKLAQSSGCDGVVCSPLEVLAIKKELGTKFKTITPGIRPQGSDQQDQKRITTPSEAIKLGADFMVIGRPITHAANPKATLMSILAE